MQLLHSIQGECKKWDEGFSALCTLSFRCHVFHYKCQNITFAILLRKDPTAVCNKMSSEAQPKLWAVFPPSLSFFYVQREEGMLSRCACIQVVFIFQARYKPTYIASCIVLLEQLRKDCAYTQQGVNEIYIYKSKNGIAPSYSGKPLSWHTAQYFQRASSPHPPVSQPWVFSTFSENHKKK